MTFAEFANTIGNVIRAESSTHVFARTLFDSIIPDDKAEVLNEYSESSFKAFYNGTGQITRLAKKISIFVQPELFETFIDNYEDQTVQLICDAFVDQIPDINCLNAGIKLGELFAAIIVEAASDKKANPRKKTGDKLPTQLASAPGQEEPAPTLDNLIKKLHIIQQGRAEDIDYFRIYVNDAIDYYSAKKTLLYAEKPRPFDQLYICNDLRYHYQRTTHIGESYSKNTISNGTVEQLENESKYIIIQGTGGIGKSMYLTHLFLNSAANYGNTHRLPIFVSLKDYRENTANIIELISNTVHEFDEVVPRSAIIQKLESKKAVLLLDGLDEIQSALRDSFNKDLEAFIKSYPGNPVFITSRPVDAFVSYSQFSLLDIEPLSKEQALALVEKLDFWDEESKQSFLVALDQKLYSSHQQFASNPLLLTIMLMTFSSFGEVPAKMHVFYAKAYETMARLHDATKGSFLRPLHTKLTPEDFAKYFAQFCARTYSDEVLEFSERSFASYMDKVINRIPGGCGIRARDFLLDLTENLCIMYCEGEKYYFIHRSFQEYFAAVHFATDYDEKLTKIGDFFEKQQHRSYSDKTFDMLYLPTRG